MAQEPAAGGSLAAALPVIFIVMSVLPQLSLWIIPFVLLGGFVVVMSGLAAQAQRAQQGEKSQGEGAAAAQPPPPGETIELRSTAGLKLLVMKARWGIWPEEAVDAFKGELRELPACALMNPMQLRSAMSGRIAVLRRKELRAMGVRSWLDVMRAVAATGPQALLIVNVDDELLPLSLPSGAGPSAIAASRLPTAMLRETEGEALLQAIKSGPVQLQGLCKIEVALARAEELFAAAKYAESVEVLSEELEEDQGANVVSKAILIALYVRKSDALRLSGRPEIAAAEARKAVDLDPECAEAWVSAVQAYRAAGEREAAKKAVEHATDLYEVKDPTLEALALELLRPPTEVAAEWKSSGNALFKEHKFVEARRAYTAALEAVPAEDTHAELRSACLGNRAACAQQLHDWDAVIADATAALELRTGNLKVLIRRAIAYEALERYSSALVDAREVLRSDPRHSQANAIQHRAGKALRELGIADPSSARCAEKVESASSSSQESASSTQATAAGSDEGSVASAIAPSSAGFATEQPEEMPTAANSSEKPAEQSEVASPTSGSPAEELESELAGERLEKSVAGHDLPHSGLQQALHSTSPENPLSTGTTCKSQVDDVLSNSRSPCFISPSPTGETCNSQNNDTPCSLERVKELEAALRASEAEKLILEQRCEDLEATVASAKMLTPNLASVLIENAALRSLSSVRFSTLKRNPSASDVPSELKDDSCEDGHLQGSNFLREVQKRKERNEHLKHVVQSFCSRFQVRSERFPL